MAVYTDLSDAELEAFLAAYAVGAATSFKGIAEGVENSNFLLETERGRFILTIYEKRVAAADLPFFMSVMETLADAGLPAPRPIRTRAGDTLHSAGGKPAALIAFLPGVSPKRPSPAHCAAIGETMARMHDALANMPNARANALDPAAWGALVRPRLALADSLRPGLGAAIAEHLETLAGYWPTGLPCGVIHADLFPDNALFIGERVTGVIDYYFACRDALAYDLAVALNAWCFEPDGAFNVTKAARLIAAYEGVRPLQPEERAALPILCRGAAMRFFATRLADWADTPDSALVRRKDPLEYADKLAFHARARSAGDYGVASS